LGPFPLVQVSHIANDTLGKGWGIASYIHLLVKVIVQGQGHQETFSKKVSWEHLPELQSKYRVALG